jgi:hypothetical protein
MSLRGLKAVSRNPKRRRNISGDIMLKRRNFSAADSPDDLNDYIHVAALSCWVVFGAVAALLAGALIWFGVAGVELPGGDVLRLTDLLAYGAR